MRFTIEARQLTSEYTHRPAIGSELKQLTVEAASPDDAIEQYLADQRSELVSLTRPLRGVESIATVKKDDSVFLVRVYAA